MGLLWLDGWEVDVMVYFSVSLFLPQVGPEASHPSKDSIHRPWKQGWMMKSGWPLPLLLGARSRFRTWVPRSCSHAFSVTKPHVFPFPVLNVICRMRLAYIIFLKLLPLLTFYDSRSCHANNGLGLSTSAYSVKDTNFYMLSMINGFSLDFSATN